MTGNLNIKKWIACYPYVIFFLGAIIVLLQSPLAPFANKLSHSDSNVYIYCSEQILKGKIMYKELFDHKGPVLYLFNIAGLLIGKGNPTGIWFIEIAMLFISLIFIYKSIKLYFNNIIAFISTLSCLLLFLPTLESGNRPEEFAVPFISISLYYFLIFLKNYRIKNYQCAIIAFCFSFALLLKPNNIAVWIIGYIFVFVILLRKRNLKELFLFLFISVITFLIACLPFAAYFSYTDSWADFKYCIWDFNKSYSDVSFFALLRRTFKNLWLPPFSFNPIHVFLYIFFITLVISFKHIMFKKEVFFIILIIILSSIFLLSGYHFPHYYLILIPALAFPYAVVYDFIKKKVTVNQKLILCFFVLFFTYASINESRNVLFRYNFLSVDGKTGNSIFKKYSEIDTLISFIKENSTETDKISVLGNECWVYIESGRESVSKYSYQLPITSVKFFGQKIVKEYIEDVKEGNPRIIITGMRSNSLHNNSLKDINEILETKYKRYVYPDLGCSIWMLKSESEE